MNTITDWHNDRAAIAFSEIVRTLAEMDDAGIAELSKSVAQQGGARTSAHVMAQESDTMAEKLAGRIRRLESGIFPILGTMLAAFAMFAVAIA